MPTKPHYCLICNAPIKGQGKYCPPPRPCRGTGMQRTNAARPKNRSVTIVAPGHYGERRMVLLAAYAQATEERKAEMLEWHEDLRGMLE